MSLIFYYQQLYSWQEPNSTEKTAFENLLKYYTTKINFDDDIAYYAYPWANMIEYALREKLSLWRFVMKNVKTFEKTNRLTITTFQSYRIWNYIDDFKTLNINVIFSPHAEKKLSEKIYCEKNILVLPMFLIPIITPDSKLHGFNHDELLKCSDITCAFMGNVSYGEHRCTTFRQKMCETLEGVENIFIKTTNEWHFDNKIYGKDLKLKKYDQSKDKQQKHNEDLYLNIMKKSKYGLCPFGTGPNSFRISETIMFEKIPIIIADKLWLPEVHGLNIEDYAYSINENLIDDVSEYQKIFDTDDECNKSKLKNISVVKKYIEDISNPISEFLNQVFTLLIVMYNVKDKERLTEYEYVFEKNIKNQYINRIVVFYELINDEIPANYNFLKHEKIKIVYVKKESPREISFNELIEYCNDNLIGSMCIISNNDIYYDDTLSKIRKIDLIKNSHVLAITRNNFFDFRIKKNNTVWTKNEGSQDTWIFCAPIKTFEPVINIGWIASDNRIAYEFEKLGYHIYNPTHDINCVHYQHQDQNTNLTKYSHRGDGPIKFLELDYLNNNKNVNIGQYDLLEQNLLDATTVKNKLNYRAVRQFYNDQKLRKVIGANVVCKFSIVYPATTFFSIFYMQLLQPIPNRILYDEKCEIQKNSIIITDNLDINQEIIHHPIIFLCDESNVKKINKINMMNLIDRNNLKLIFFSHNAYNLFCNLHHTANKTLNYEIIQVGSDLNIGRIKEENIDEKIRCIAICNKNQIKKIRSKITNIEFVNQPKPLEKEHYYEFSYRKENMLLKSDVLLMLTKPNIYNILDAIIFGVIVIVPDDPLFYGEIPDKCIVKIPMEKLSNVNYILDKIKYAHSNRNELAKCAFDWYLKFATFDKWNSKIKDIIIAFQKECTTKVLTKIHR